MAEAENTLSVAPRERQPLVLTLILLIEVAIFAVALVWIAYINSQEHTQNALQVNQSKLAARQGSLVERISSDLAQLQVVPADPTRNAAAASDITVSYGTLASTQHAFSAGAQTIDLSGKKDNVPPLTSPAERQLLAQIDRQLGDVHGLLAPFADPQNLPKNVQMPARDASTAISGLSDLTNSLAAEVATEGDNGANGGLRDWLFRIAIVMVLAMVATLFERVSRGRAQVQAYAEDLGRKREEAEAATRQLADAKAGTDLIMETVDRGLFLIRPDFRIDGQYSRELEKIFRTPNLNGYNFLNVLQTLLTERTFEISRDYLGLLFDKKKKERTVLRVNPLSEIEVHFANPAGGFDSKFLNFSFRRIVDDEAVTRVFVSVSDVTDRVRLERELRESEMKKERQFEFLLGVLHVEPKALDDFLSTAQEQIGHMNDALRASDFATSGSRMDLLRQRLDVVYRAVHTIKGNASMLQLTYFQKICDGFEAKIVALRDRRALSGDDFLAIVIAQSELRQDVEELHDLRERFVGAGRHIAAREVLAPASVPAPADIVAGISALATAVAARSGKTVRIDAGGFSSEGLDEDVRRSIKDVLIQLTRNAVMHGVETPHARELVGKAATATLTIASKLRPGSSFAFSFRDDGQGLDPTYIRERAVAKKLISPKTAAAMNDQQIVALIFRSGFSTTDESTTDAGRGIGMNVIKEIIVDRLGGRLTLNSDPGKFTEFGFEIPLDTPKTSTNGRTAELAYS